MKTTTGKKHIDDLHFEHQLWLSESKFFADELKIYRNRLEEVASRNSKPEVTKQIEHFQNQFIIQKEQLDIMNHDVNAHESELAKYAKANPIAIDHKLFDDHEKFSDRMATFKKIYGELKKEFTNFLVTWM
jgi:hypothetical protein